MATFLSWSLQHTSDDTAPSRPVAAGEISAGWLVALTLLLLLTMF
ncbi:MAG TPA: hypothetical protein PKA13_14670 [Geminicoccaceae bacterium]|nr:hypothetical protein [Geminicoccus sp.]HMU51015.1 hypothetical protein [Geminicoccaceae bacterium]